MRTPISFPGRIRRNPASHFGTVPFFSVSLPIFRAYPVARGGYAARLLPVLLFLCFGSIVASSPLAAQFSFKSFSRSDSLCYRGDAQLVQGGVVRLCPKSPFHGGAIWHRRKQQVATGFTTKFHFRMGETGAAQEADGIALVIQNSDSCALGNIAEGIGYQGIPNSIAVEFDTWFNNGVDPNNNHISVHTRGLSPNRADFTGAIATRDAVPILGLGVPRNIIVDYDGAVLRVYIGECQMPILEVAVDLDSLLRLDNGRAWVGLTAATGYNYQDHDLFSWEFQSVGKTVNQKCFGDSILLEGPEGYPRYRWSTGDSTRSISVRASGVYTLWVGGSLLCPSQDIPYVFDVSVTPRTFSPYIFPSGTIILCRGDSVVLTALTGPYSGDRFMWSTGDTLRSIVAKKSGKYAATLIDSNGCEYRLDTVQVFIRPNPEPRIQPSDTILSCQGDSVKLWVPDVFASYEWSTGAAEAEIVVSEPGTYTLTVTDRDGCAGYDTAVVLMPRGVSVSGDTAICFGAGTQLIASGRMDYLWTPPEGLSCSDCPNPIASPEETTVYAVQGTNDGNCPSSDTVTVTVRSVEADAGIDTVLCLGDSIRLNGRGSGTYTWSPTQNISCLDCSDPVVFPRESTTYYLSVRDQWGCTGTDSVRVTVRSSGNVEASGGAAICPGDSTVLSASGAGSYLWSPIEGLSCFDCPSPIATPDKSTVYYVIGSNGPDECPAIDSVVVMVYDLPIADAGGDTVICEGASVRLSAQGGAIYRWDPSPDLSCLDCSDPLASPTATTKFYVTAISAEGCEGWDSVEVVVRPGIVVDAGEDRAICLGDTTAIGATGTGGIRWLWEPAEGLNCVDCPDPFASPTKTTTYRITVWNTEGCVGSDSIGVFVREEPGIVRLRIHREYHEKTDTPMVISVESIGPAESTDIARLEFALEYDYRVVRIDAESISRLLGGTALEGWNVEIVENDAGKLVLRLTAPQGQTLTLPERGELLRFEGRLYLSNVRGTELPFTVRSPSRCFAFESEAGYAMVDSICGLNLRLIELTAQKYIPPVVYPNPAHERVTFEFGLGLDGPTRLEVFDALGNRVGLIADEVLASGRYSVEWDVRDVVSGVYWYRLTSGDWSEGGQVRVEN